MPLMVSRKDQQRAVLPLHQRAAHGTSSTEANEVYGDFNAYRTTFDADGDVISFGPVGWPTGRPVLEAKKKTSLDETGKGGDKSCIH